MAKYRPLFCRAAGFEHVSRYVTGLVLSPNKTLQGIYEAQVWAAGAGPSRRAMHEAVFAAGWESARLMAHHRQVVAPAHRGHGREVISLDWTLCHHERGEQIYGVKVAYDYVERRTCPYQTVVPAVIANRDVIDGIAAEVQAHNFGAHERDYLQATAKES